MKKSTLAIIFFFVATFSLFSQTRITGQILDINTNQPIIGLQIRQSDYYGNQNVGVNGFTDSLGKFNMIFKDNGPEYVILTRASEGYSRITTHFHLLQLMKSNRPILLESIFM